MRGCVPGIAGLSHFNATSLVTEPGTAQPCTIGEGRRECVGASLPRFTQCMIYPRSSTAKPVRPAWHIAQPPGKGSCRAINPILRAPADACICRVNLPGGQAEAEEGSAGAGSTIAPSTCQVIIFGPSIPPTGQTLLLASVDQSQGLVFGAAGQAHPLGNLLSMIFPLLLCFPHASLPNPIPGWQPQESAT
ncbi:hypothetical protein GGTG_06160 [Gaeumannomyces tritici R3-111a-1]|uniref:Uncharacterized protein n=1 Tax=Gaeumannomyces tritici (strain R3-111a-1) TaxID=644352 RepID=J3NY05_GAET3|nr:hypothetical protein GGTG_06160 [Gaeumannomyces tritici R3-111a-1]EJT76238.1 hypothetical protein GGTG_06160 [Gaeumannomyces tritici R3-111a-1]